MIAGRLTRVAGPVVCASGLERAGLYDVVEVGEAGLVGEIIRLDSAGATIQIYEENTMMRPGEPVVCRGHPLSVRLGPGLLGSIYDGTQRPLTGLKNTVGSFLSPGAKGEPLDIMRRWAFLPRAKAGDRVGGGRFVGTIQETASIEHRIMTPPGLKDSTFAWVAPFGEYRIDEAVARMEDGTEIFLAHEWPVRLPRPTSGRLPPNVPLVTGLRVIDMLFPIAKGGCAAIPGGFGTGKTMTQHAIAKWCDADIIVYIGCGERGNEMTDVLTEFPRLVDPRTGRSLMERTILIANTSNMPVAAREVSIYTGITLAEYYRDMGYDVAVMADSTSRWAEALRELSGRLEEMPAEEGFPAYLPTRLAEFYERGGRVRTLGGDSGSVSIIGAVSPPGGDFSEPVTQHTKRFIRCFWALDRELANARHYPAISWTDSYSEYAEELAEYWDGVDPAWRTARDTALDLMKRERKLADIVRLIGSDALPDTQRLILLTAEMMKNGFLQQSSFDAVDMFCSPPRQILLLRCVLEFHRRANDALKSGAPLPRIFSMPIRERIPRLKALIANGQEEELRDFLSEIDSEFGELTRQYRTEAVR